ncbi:hypothetical protein [Burkholderia pseudomultivorans]|uniref:hypothetical protein n=1 Tax=Burkholderia pseudomultivorans TaxID=1207504 RepID=UPI0012D95D3B|nr:hypothetical protein [Burkholderia pseudomultivorans]
MLHPNLAERIAATRSASDRSMKAAPRHGLPGLQGFVILAASAAPRAKPISRRSANRDARHECVDGANRDRHARRSCRQKSRTGAAFLCAGPAIIASVAYMDPGN